MNPQEISAQEFEELLALPQPPLVLDVREPYEQATGMIRGALSMPMSTMADRLAELPRDRTIVTYCHVGDRSWGVARFLVRKGFPDVKSLRSGIEAWQALQKSKER